jgi:hypothetical protein
MKKAIYWNYILAPGMFFPLAIVCWWAYGNGVFPNVIGELLLLNVTPPAF